MPRYKIFRDYGYASEPEEEETEADSLEEAQDEAWEWAMQQVGAWAEPLDEDETKTI